jgi:hypothetical protein
MFYELIYTRCRQGIDITKNGHQISGDGYKVYSCTPAIMQEGNVDLPFLANAAQAKQSCSDPDFMDDAYLFYVPDSGDCFFINFHPIPFDANAKGDFSHRPGNFVNHALIGDYSKFYPYQMFQDDSVWNAKTKGEAYYYENPADTLPERGDLDSPSGYYSLDEIRAFIADGREEALKKAVAFLISQYKEEPEKRKFLVIKDDSSKKIELWVAAIECAFSPRIAGSIPFATRMDKFANTNRYTVKTGKYQSQMNLQDPNQKQRFRAMIVGVDERDKSNVSASRPLANSPFVLLDGKQKQAVFDAEISNRYYQLITQFNDEHQKFCCEFLQSFCLSKQDEKISKLDEIYNLYEIYNELFKSSMTDTRKLANTLDNFGKYQAEDSDIYRDIYKRINSEVSRFIKDNFSCALNIVSWLQKASAITGDTGANQRLTDIVSKNFTEIVFSRHDNSAKKSYWTQIKNTDFAKSIAQVISDINTVRDGLSGKTFTPEDIVVILTIYLESASMTNNIDQQNIGGVVKYVIKVCCQNNDADSLHTAVLELSKIKSINSQEFLFALIKNEDKKIGEFVIADFIDHDTAVIASDNSLQAFCKILNNSGLGSLAGTAVIKRANILNKSSEKERLIETVGNMNFIGDEALVKVFEAIDSRISVSEDNIPALTELIQSKKPNNAKCKNSAHLYALNILSNNRKKQKITDVLKGLNYQDFPSIKDEKYINKFTEYLIKESVEEKELLIIFDILFHAPKEYFSAYIGKLINAAAKYHDKWTALLKYASGNKSRQIDDDIIKTLADSVKNEKSLSELGSRIDDENILKYYNGIAEKAREIILSDKNKSGKDKRTGLFG